MGLMMKKSVLRRVIVVSALGGVMCWVIGFGAVPRAHGDDLSVARAEFKQLSLRMIGMTTFQGATSTFIEHPGRLDRAILTVGDEISGFKIISIQPEYTIFERRAMQFWLPLGDVPDDETDQGFAVESQSVALESKPTNEGLKSFTEAYSDARVIALASSSAPWALKAAANQLHGASIVEESFILPLKGRVSSGFGYRKQPMGGARRYHQGVDIAAPNRSPIRAARRGTVRKVSRSWAKGLYITVDHSEGFETGYFHLSKATVEVGQWIAQGEIIGLEGTSGNSSGPHLHFEIHKNGQAVDPAIYLRELNSN